MKVEMTQLYLCEEPYWSKYDQSDLYEHPIEINVISDGELQHLVPCSSNLVYWYSGGYKSIFSFPFRHYSIASAGRGSFSRRNPSDESIIGDYHCGRCWHPFGKLPFTILMNRWQPTTLLLTCCQCQRFVYAISHTNVHGYVTLGQIDNICP